MKKAQTVNVLTDGLLMDLNPIVTPNNVLTNCLNGTLVTYQGNENALQNDMGNGRVETAYLPEGYIPVGTAELGGIIYIVSYNPLIDKCQIGSFPSPERNISKSEISDNTVKVSNDQFQEKNGKLKNVILKVKLLSQEIDKLNPGDKYIVYSTNEGITLNREQISDVGNIKHTIDGIPRNVTIHIVSIGDDGKIVYLDDTLKWNEKTITTEEGEEKRVDYYIKECAGQDNIETDINSQRSLVSSPYNIFSSKVPGELALLFELKVIDSFNVTWDAEVESVDDNNKIANVSLYVNFTSSDENINAKHIILTDSNSYPEGSLVVPVEKGWHCTLPDFTNRKNDGSDEEIQVSVGQFKYKADTTLSDYIWNYEVTPAMKFGYLEYLAVNGSINFQEVGSGRTDFNVWKYFIQKDDFQLNWGLSAYPEKGKGIHRVVMTFIPFDKILEDKSSIIQDPSKSYPTGPYPQYIISGKKSYSGSFKETIRFGKNSEISNDGISKDYLYLVDICLEYGSMNDSSDIEYRHNFRWLYTTGQWNESYQNENCSDFQKLTLNDNNAVKLDTTISVIDNIKSTTNTYNSNVNIPRNDSDSEPMSAQVTTINYDKNSSTFNTDINNIIADVNTYCASYPELFQFNKLKGDTYNIEISSTEILHDPFIVTSDRPSSIAGKVIPTVSETFNDTLGGTIKTILENGITNDDLNNSAKDQFKATLVKGDNDSHFEINVIGALFARINAELVNRTVQIEQEIRPLIYHTSDLNKFGLILDNSNSNSNPNIYFDSIYKEYHNNAGGNKPFRFIFRKYTGTGTDTGKEQEYDSADDWNPGDHWTKNYWSSVEPYTEYLNRWMIGEDKPIQCMHWGGGISTKYGVTTIQGSTFASYGLWVKTDDGVYVPINCWLKSVVLPSDTIENLRKYSQNLAKLLALFYMSIYYVNTSTSPKELSVVDCINYMTSYYETLKINIQSELNIGHHEGFQNSQCPIMDNITLKTKTGETISLNEFVRQCKEASSNTKQLINFNNLSLDNIATVSIKDKSISHTFRIYNTDLYNLFEKAKSTTIKAIKLSSTNTDWEECNPKTTNKLYVYNGNDFEELKRDSAKYIYTLNSEESTSIQKITTNDPNNSILQVNNGYCNVFARLPILETMEYVNGTVQFEFSKLLGSTKALEFTIHGSTSDPSYVKGNSAYGLTVGDKFYL